jgi:hypothetical protein
MGTTAAVAAIITAVTGLTKTGYDIANPPTSPKLPHPMGTDTSGQALARLPGAKADVAARTGGGISPNFLAGVIGQETGAPGAGLDILEEIRRSLGGGAGQSP